MSEQTNLMKLATLYNMVGCAYVATQYGLKLHSGTDALVNEIADWLKQRAVDTGEVTWAELNEMTNGIPPAFRALDMPELEDDRE